MRLHYDPVDTLYIPPFPPHTEQESDRPQQPGHRKIEIPEVLHFHKRFEQGEAFDIPVSLDMRTARSA